MASAPGRTCPVSYRYGAGALARASELEVETLWVAGGLYGNPFALERLIALYEGEPGEKALVFNGDFHWFDIDEVQFKKVADGVQRYLATRGNVETELARPEAGAGCGCAYPDWVDEGTVERSNAIIERLRATAQRFPECAKRLAALPMNTVVQLAGKRVAVVHGDADSLAGWAFSQEALATPPGRATAVDMFAHAKVDVFASSHTCLPVLQRFDGGRVIVNNGAAGMPNFRDAPFGLATRISVRQSAMSLYSVKADSLHIEAIALEYDAEAWRREFLAQWAPGSAAHRSYYERIVHGPRYALEQALRTQIALAA